MVSAQEYLEFLQALYEPPRWARRAEMRREIKRLRRKAKAAATDGDRRAYESLLARGAHRVTEALSAVLETVRIPLLETMPAQARAIIEDVPIGVLPLRSANAHVMRSLNGDPIVVLDRGMMNANRLFSETVSYLPIVSAAYGENRSIQWMVRMYEVMINYFQAPGYAPVFGDVPTAFRRIADELVLAMDAFVVAHELAHVVAGHLEKAHATQMPLSGLPQSVTVFQYSQAQELEADALAFDWMKAGLGRTYLSSSTTLRAPFEVLLMLHLVECNLGFPARYGTHPRAIERLETLFAALQQDHRELVPEYRIRMRSSPSLAVKRLMEPEMFVDLDAVAILKAAIAELEASAELHRWDMAKLKELARSFSR